MSLLELKPSGATKSGGLLFAAAVFVGGFLKIVIPSGAVPNSASQAKPVPALSTTNTSAEKKDGYPSLLAEKIKESYGCLGQSEPSTPEDLSHWNVPAS